MPLFTVPPNSLCILRLSAIGDVCNAIAAVQAIQRQWPNTKLTWVVGKTEAALLTPLLPNVQIIPFDKKKGIRGMISVIKALRSEQFDALLHLQTAFRASILSLGIKADFRLGFDKYRTGDLQHFFTNVEVPSPNKPHVLDGFLAFNDTLGITPTPAEWELSIPEADTQWAKKQLTEKPTLIVAPASSKAFKNWTSAGYAGVINHAMKQGFNVILAGGPSYEEIALGQDIERQLDTPVTNLISKTTLMQLVALIDQAALLLSPDSGPAHIANALSTPVIGLYAHHNPLRTGPYYYREYVVSAYGEAIEAQTGLPATKVPWRTRVKDPLAMQRITLEQVIDRFDDVVKREGILA